MKLTRKFTKILYSIQKEEEEEEEEEEAIAE